MITDHVSDDSFHTSPGCHSRSFSRPLIASGALLTGAGAAAGEPARPIDFNREIRPILSNHCFQCHGPDAKKRKGLSKPLRLDTEQGAFGDLGGYAAIVRGNTEESELIRRITSDDANDVMPPPSTGKKLSAREVERLGEWVRQGARYSKHWSYVNPVRPRMPEVRDRSWPRNEIDFFVLARLEREGLAPSAEADRYALVRRLALDLTGLPPTPEEVERFVRDPDPDAYERLVDRLLDKPSYGEHWGRMWLDLARYADSAGYADDPLAHDLGLPRLRHPVAQRQQAVRPVHDRAARRRSAPHDHGAGSSSPPPSIATR